MGELYRRFGKRLLDVSAAVVALVVLAPVLVGLACLVVMLLGRPVFFRQQRPGRQGRPFHLVKFRTMTGARDADGDLRPDADRLTRFGRLLRSTSLDELPELFNVLSGDMSLVGPRPLLLRDFRRYPKHAQMRRFSRPPGLTGLWQVSGRSETSDRERIRLDLEYVDHWSLWLDLKILSRTVPAVLSGRGAT
jgi:sugar transferase EpsL